MAGNGQAHRTCTDHVRLRNQSSRRLIDELAATNMAFWMDRASASWWLALSSFLVATHELGAWPWIDRRPLRERYFFKHVSRTDLNPVLNAPGRLESSKRTVDPV